MSNVLNSEGQDLRFLKARTHNVWLDKPIGDALLQRVYDLAKMGPTSANMRGSVQLDLTVGRVGEVDPGKLAEPQDRCLQSRSTQNVHNQERPVRVCSRESR